MQRPQNLPERLLELRVQALCRLVKEQNVGIQKQDFCQRRALLFTARKVVGVTVEQLRQLAEGNDLCKSLVFSFGFWQNLQQILVDGGFQKKRLWILGQHPDAAGDV